MKKIKFENFTQLENGSFVGLIKFKQYIQLFKEGDITISEDIRSYIKNRDYKNVDSDDKMLNQRFTVNLNVLKNEINKIALNEKTLEIEAEEIHILEGFHITNLISKLEDKYLNGYLVLIINNVTKEEAINLLMPIKT